jgi:hypothetical protein
MTATGRIKYCRVVELPKIKNSSGNLTFIESDKNIDFNIKRVYYLYDVPGGAERGGHAHKNLHQFIIAISGSFDIILDDGENKKKFQLNRGYYGLKICPYVWRELNNFSSGAVCLVLASEHYDEEDYIRDYDTFVTKIKHLKG